MNKRIFVSLITIFLIILAACSESSSNESSSGSNKSDDQESIKIGFVGPLAGEQSKIGLSVEQGVQLAINEINENGGILGKEIEYFSRDDDADPEKGRSAVQELIHQSKVDFIIGPLYSSVAQGAVPLMEEAEIINILPTSTLKEWSDGIAHPYTYRQIFTTDMLAEALINYAVDHKGAEKIGILSWADSFGDEATKSAEEVLDSKGIKEYQVEKFNVGALDVVQQSRSLVDFESDVILLFAAGPDIARAVKDIRAVDSEIPILIHQNGADGDVQSLMSEEEIKNTYSVDFTIAARSQSDEIHENMSQIESKIVEEFGKTDHILVNSALGYDAVYILANAIEGAQSKDSNEVKKVLDSDYSYEGLVANFNFTEENHHGLPLDAITVVELGSFKDGTNTIAPELE